MKHIRFMTTQHTICEFPDELDSDFVVQDMDMNDPTSCGVCLSLLMAHNKREYEREGLVNILQSHNRLEPPRNEDKLAASRGCVHGFILASIFWLIVALVLYYFLCS